MHILKERNMILVFRNKELFLQATVWGGMRAMYAADFIFQKNEDGSWHTYKDRSGFLNKIVPDITIALGLVEKLLDTE